VRILCATFAAGGGGGGAFRFRLKTSDRRCSYKFTLYGVPLDPTVTPSAMLAARALTLWVAEVEKDETLSRWVPCTNLDGSTSATPILIPRDAGLGGYSLETDTTADGIEGLVTIPAQDPGAPAGALYLKGLCQPRVQQLVPWSQWDEIRAETDLQLLGDAVVT
jgi:hypothetical protein